jgi:ketosteroid isomerase-like protein
MEGTNTGPLEGPMGTVQPTHRKVSSKGVQIFRIENGKIAETRLYFDLLDQMTQLGLVPAPATV